MKPIYILCLHNVRTGGPEAIHQLSDALIEQGFDARLVYYDWGQIAELERAAPSEEGYLFGLRENPIEEYARYKVVVADSVPNNADVVVVLPEPLCHLAPKFNKATVLIWWLSVDNGFAALSKVNLNHLRRPGVQHAVQSVYANRFIASLGLTPAPGAFLSDYTSDLSAYASPTGFSERPRLALFGTRKSIVNFEQLFAEVRRLDPSITCQTLSELSRAQVMDLLSLARVYVETGVLPGKDRMPREAQRMGCIPIVAPHGAGATDFDMAYVRAYPEEIPALVVKAMDAEPERYSPNERTQFFREVREVFSAL